MRNEREYCSDDIAVKHCGNAVAYAHTLADTAALCSKHRQHTIPNMAMAASGGDLKQRVVRLVNHHCTPENEAGKWLAATLIIVLVLGIASKQFLTPSLFEFGSNPLSYQQSEKQEPSSLLTTDLAKSSLANYLLSSDVPNFLPPEKSNKVENSNFLTDFSADNTLVLVNKTQTIEPINHLDGLLVKQETISNIALVDNKDKIQAKKKSALIIKKQTTDTVLAQSKNVITDSDKKLTQSNTLLAQTAKVEKLANQAINIATSKITKQEKVLLTKNTRQNNPNASTQVLASPSLKQQKNNASLTIATYTKPKPLETVVADSMAVETISSNVVLSNSMFTNTTLKQTGNANEGINDLYAVENNLFTPLASLPPAVYKAQLIKAVDPKYPATAKRRGIEIEVKVNFTIDVSGRIKDLDFEHQSKVSYFRSSIKSAMQKWAFEPAKKGGKAIESQMSKIFSFSLQG
jgi:TonB family protein